MAKSTSNKSTPSKGKDSNSEKGKKSIPQSGKATRKKLGMNDAPPELLDDDTKRNITGVVLAAVALVLILIVALPTNALITSALSLVLRRGLGIGAFLIPIALIAIAATFIVRFDREHVPTRAVLGLALILFGLLILLALLTPGAMGADGPTMEIFSDRQVVLRGGYIGAGPAYLGLSLLGLPIAIVIAIGIMIVGLVVIGFSVRKLIEAIEQKRQEFAEREDEELGVMPDGPFIPVMPATRFRNGHESPVNASVNTRRIGEEDRSDVITRKLAASKMLHMDIEETETPAKTRKKPGSTAINESGSRALTRKLGAQKDEPKLPEETAPEPELEAKPERPAQDGNFQLPDRSLLKLSKTKRKSKAIDAELTDTAANLQQTLEDFNIMATVVDWVAGPTVTLFEVDLPPGVRVSRITALQDDIALALAAPGVRIFAPIPGTHYVGIEVPNVTRDNVLLGDVLKDVHGGPLELAIGKDVEGNAIICDLAKMPHLLIGGTTGSGKSVGINAMIMSMIMRATPTEVRFIMIDPKRVEFAPYDGIPHLYVPVVTEPKEAASALSWGVAEMERRLKLFSKVGVRNIASFNEKVRSGEIPGDEMNGAGKTDEGSLEEAPKAESSAESNAAHEITNPITGTPGAGTMPYIVIIIDELADLMMNVGKEVEFSISRIAQLARAAGIHLIVATQRPSANVVTGLIKANITNRMAFNVASSLDSRVILDTSGAESLIGNGDLLLSKPEFAKPVRIQGCFTSDDEIAAVVAAVKAQGEPEYHSEILKTNLITLGDTSPDGSGGSSGADDPLLWEAADIVVASGLGSTSNIQRKLKVGYSRAGRIMDMLEEKGVVGPPNGSKPRDVLVDAMELETLKAFEAADELEG